MFTSRERCLPLLLVITATQITVSSTLNSCIFDTTTETAIFFLYRGRICRMLADLYISRIHVTQGFDVRELP